MSFSFPGGLLYGRGGHLLETCGGQIRINLEKKVFFIFDKIGESLSFSSSGWCSTVHRGSAGPAYGACQDCPNRTPGQVRCLHDDRHHHYTLKQFIFIFLISWTDLCIVSNFLHWEMSITLKGQAGFIGISEMLTKMFSRIPDYIPINRWVAGNRPLSLWLAAFIPRLLLCLVLVSTSKL